MNGLGFIGTVPYTRLNIGSGDAAIYNTIAKMQQIIQASSGVPIVRQLALNIIEGINYTDKYHQAEAIFNFTRDEISYQPDPFGTEYLILPEVLVQQHARGERMVGDCDDTTMLLGAMLKSLGFRVALKAASYNPDRALSHVYLLVNVNGTWLAGDAIKKDQVLGWEAPNATRTYEVEV